MARYHLEIEYDGTPYVGWQRQKEDPSVQQALEEAAAKFANNDVICQGAGRTDAGVHALSMAAHIDLPKPYETDTVRDAINAHLRGHPIAVLSATAVADDFHARFSCTRRHYLYRLSERRAPLTLDELRVWRVGFPLDVAAMARAAQDLTGRHDFTTFRSVHCQSQSPIKTLDDISVARVGDEIHIRCHALSFLHNQVRSFVGSLERVGSGRWQVEDLKAALKAKDRSRCGTVAPAHGLYFVKADYA